MDPFEQLAQELSADPKAEQELLSRMTDDQLKLYADAKSRVSAPVGTTKPGDVFPGMGERGLNMSNPAWRQGAERIGEDWNKGVGTAIDIADLLVGGTVLGGGAYSAYKAAQAAPELVKALPWVGRLLGGFRGHALGEAASQIARAGSKASQATPAVEQDIMALIKGNKLPVSANPAATAARAAEDKAYLDRVRLRQPVSHNPASNPTGSTNYRNPPRTGGGPEAGPLPAGPLHDPAALEKLILRTDLPEAQTDRLIQIMERMRGGKIPTWIERQFIENVQSGKTATKLRKP